MTKSALLTMFLALGLYVTGCEKPAAPPSGGAMKGPPAGAKTPAPTPKADEGPAATGEPDIDKVGEAKPADEPTGDEPAASTDSETTPEEPAGDDKPAKESESSEQ